MINFNSYACRGCFPVYVLCIPFSSIIVSQGNGLVCAKIQFLKDKKLYLRIMEEKDITYDCSRGCYCERTSQGELITKYSSGCCKLSAENWLNVSGGISNRKYFEVRFKNTRKGFYENTSGQILKIGDLVVVEAQNGHDVGIITLEGPVVMMQMTRNRIDLSKYEFRKIYRKAKAIDAEKWQEAIAREHKTMIRARQIAAELKLDMKIGDVEFQGDGTKAIFYYIADARVDFRQLIKVFAEEFRIRIEMKQIGARQEAGLIGGIGVCGRALCCSRFMADFQSITTAAARCQDLSLNPQKLAGQCSKLKCCINYEAPVYMEMQRALPYVNQPLELEDGLAYLVKTDLLSGTMWFSYEKNNMSNMIPLSGDDVKEIIRLNRKGEKGASILAYKEEESADSGFIDAVGDDSIERFDKKKRKKNNGEPRRDKSRGKRSKPKPKGVQHSE